MISGTTYGDSLERLNPRTTRDYLIVSGVVIGAYLVRRILDWRLEKTGRRLYGAAAAVAEAFFMLSLLMAGQCDRHDLAVVHRPSVPGLDRRRRGLETVDCPAFLIDRYGHRWSPIDVNHEAVTSCFRVESNMLTAMELVFVVPRSVVADITGVTMSPERGVSRTPVLRPPV